MDISIMIEGQHGLNWARWKRMGQAVEDLGFAGLYRSDHFTDAKGPLEDSLEMWLSFGWLADNTHRIEFGPLVTPFSFRDPAFTARMGIQVDNLSGGRFRLGVGAGWQEREHRMFGFQLLSVKERFKRFEEALQVLTRLVKSDQPVSFTGAYYSLEDALLLPRPERAGGPPIVIGGNGMKLTLPLAACYADEWNANFITAQKYHELNQVLNTYLLENERDPSSVRRTLMTNVRFGRNAQELQDQLDGRNAAELREAGILVGQASELVDQLSVLADAGVEGVMLQWLGLDDIDRLEGLAKAVLA